MPKTILITGGSGLLGSAWASLVKHQYRTLISIHTHPYNLNGVSATPLDLFSFDSIDAFCSRFSVDIIVNTVALTDIERCEACPSLAHELNVTIPSIIAKVCVLRNIKLVHISTDHLFSGTEMFSSESSPVSPLNVYGDTKAFAEKIVLDLCPDSIIVRTNFFGPSPSLHRKSFSTSIIESLKQGRPLRLFADAFFTPIHINLLVPTVHKLLHLGFCGVINIVGDQRLSKYEFGIIIANYFHLNTRFIQPSFLLERSDLVQRPLDLSLDNRKLVSLIGKRIPDVKTQLDQAHILD